MPTINQLIRKPRTATWKAVPAWRVPKSAESARDVYTAEAKPALRSVSTPINGFDDQYIGKVTTGALGVVARRARADLSGCVATWCAVVRILRAKDRKQHVPSTVRSVPKANKQLVIIRAKNN